MSNKHFFSCFLLFVLLFSFNAVQVLAADGLSGYTEYLSSLDRSDASSVQKAFEAFLEQQVAFDEATKVEAVMAFRDLLEEVLWDFGAIVYEPTMEEKLYLAVCDGDGQFSPDLVRSLNDPNQLWEEQSVQELVDQVLKNGMRFSMAEGSIYVQVRPDFIGQNFAPFLSEDFQVYFSMTQKDQEEGFLEDGGLVISYKELGERIIGWEDFLDNYTNFAWAYEVEDLLEWYFWVFFYGVDNTPIFSWTDDVLLIEVKVAYEDFIAKNAHRPSGRLVKEFYDLLEKENFKRTERVWDFLTDQASN